MIRARCVSRLALVLYIAAGHASAAQQLPAAPDPLLAQRTLGAPNAPITVYEMSDFQCPFCRRHVMETFPALEKEFIVSGKVRWVFINFPLTTIHPNAAAAAEFAMCAAKAGRFWPVHDLLFKYQDKWAPLKDPAPFLLTLADSVGLPRSELTPCLERGETRQLVKEDAEGAAQAGVASTPTFYIEGGLLRGSAPLPLFRQVLDSIWRQKTGRVEQ